MARAMSDPLDIARAIHREVVRLRVQGFRVEEVVVSRELQLDLTEHRLGYWDSDPDSSAIFGVRAVVQPVAGGWEVRVRAPGTGRGQWSEPGRSRRRAPTRL